MRCWPIWTGRRYRASSIGTEPTAQGRNAPCSCGSGRKYKHCCGGPNRHAAAGHAPSLLAVATRLLQSGQPAQAERLYREVLVREPAHAQATHFLGMCLIQTGRHEEGLGALRRSVALEPSNDIYGLNLGMVLMQSGALGEAEAALRSWRCRPATRRGGSPSRSTSILYRVAAICCFRCRSTAIRRPGSKRCFAASDSNSWDSNSSPA